MRVLVLSALLLSVGVGCANSAADAAGLDNGAAGSGSQVNGDQPVSLAFEVVPDLPARAQVLLKVRALPAKSYRVRFALPSGGGDPLDAVLDGSEADTDALGIATVQLTAPSTPAIFDVRASVGSVTTLLSINVKDTGFATVQVQPRYPSSALRDPTTWIATAHPGKSCADVPGIPPADGPLMAPPAAKAQAPLISQVPANTPLAITLRSGHFVGGCASVEKVAPGPDDKPQTVHVTVLDRPIDLSASPLAVTFGLKAPEATWSDALTESGDAVLDALRGTSIDDVDALLDAMREASGDSRQALENARKAENWDALLRAHWGSTAATKLRDLVGVWLTAGRKRFDESEHLFTGALTPIQQPGVPVEQGGAELTLLSVAGLPGKSSGFVDRAQVSWSASSDDTVVLGTDLYFIRSELAEALAEAAVLQDQPDFASAPALLAQALDCLGVSATLASTGPSAELAYAGCNEGCVASLCSSALVAIWRRGGDASGLTPTRISVAATGKAYVGDAAEVAGIRGSWIGQLGAGTDKATSGDLTAVHRAAD